MSSANPFEGWDPSSPAELLVTFGREPISLAPTCTHAPVICVWKSEQDHSCKIQALRDAWRRENHDFPSDDNPLALALGSAGCDSYRARMVIAHEGCGMTSSSSNSLIRAYGRLGASIRHPVPAGAVHVCNQCRPGTNTFALQGSSYNGSCCFIPVTVASHIDLVEDGKVLCIGEGGELRWCGKDEFMAVSHVWEHGWQGVSETGICSRTLDLLLFVAKLFGLNWVWIDIAMIGREPVSRSLAINSMNFVYTSSKVTVVFDRLLLSMDQGTD